MFDRVGQVRMAWSERMGPDAGPEVPDERPGIGAQHAADLGQPGRRVAEMAAPEPVEPVYFPPVIVMPSKRTVAVVPPWPIGLNTFSTLELPATVQ